MITSEIEIRHFHLFCGLGGGAKGFNNGNARVGNIRAKFRCIGGIDNNPATIRDFTRLAGVSGTVMDLFSRAQYVAFNNRQPPDDWKEATPNDIQTAASNERPHIVFLSAPCKGFSGLLSQKLSTTNKYQALNELTLRGIWLMLEAWKDDPVELVVFENVPRIASRGRYLLNQICDLLRSYGYAVAETTHDCGELGGLAQSRKRFLLVARHTEKVPAFLYEPAKKPLMGVGDILGRMPIPGEESAGPMHRIPRLQWKTWVRLAFVEAGSDWRSLKKLNVENGCLKDYLIMPENKWDNSLQYGVNEWDKPSGTITSSSRPGNGFFSVADPRPPEGQLFSKYAVTKWDGNSGTVIGGDDSGAYAVADPRHLGPAKFNNQYRIVPWLECAGTVTGAHGKGQCVADPRCTTSFNGKGKYIVTPFDGATNTVIAGSTTGQGVFAVADPRLPESNEKLITVIRALDNTWHRPFTTLELAALQGLIDPEEQIELDELSDSAWRERIGNAVPPPAAAAIAGVMGETLLLSWSGETFVLSNSPVWVRPISVALAMSDINGIR